MAENVIQFKVTMALDELQGHDLEEQCIIRVGRQVKTLEYDCRQLCGNLAEWFEISAAANKPHYLRLASSWDEFCCRYLKHDSALIDVMLQGYKILDHDAAIPMERAIAAAKAKAEPLGMHGFGAGQAGPGRGHKTDRDTTCFNGKTDRGNSYLLRRLARDHSALFAEWEAGGYPNVRQAAIAAGIVKVKTPLEHLDHWWDKATEVERAAFLVTHTVRSPL